MANCARLYLKGIKTTFGKFYCATWKPGVPVKLGDIGVFLPDDTFDVQGNLKTTFDIDFTVRLDKTADHESGSSGKDVSTKVKLAGDVPPVGSILKESEAGVIIEFANKQSFVFSFDSIKYHSIDNYIAVEEKILELFRRGKWRKEWCVVADLAHADSATIAISQSAGSKIEIKAKTGLAIDTTAEKVDLADVSLGFEFASGRGLEYKCVSSALNPVFRAMRVKAGGRGTKSVCGFTPGAATGFATPTEL